jgi:hypothetical protein
MHHIAESRESWTALAKNISENLAPRRYFLGTDLDAGRVLELFNQDIAGKYDSKYIQREGNVISGYVEETLVWSLRYDGSSKSATQIGFGEVLQVKLPYLTGQFRVEYMVSFDKETVMTDVFKEHNLVRMEVKGFSEYDSKKLFDPALEIAFSEIQKPENIALKVWHELSVTVVFQKMIPRKVVE